jgi:ribosomal protein S14
MFSRLRARLAALGAAIDRERRAWRIRCEACGRDRPLAQTGALRLWASSPIRKLGECSQCNRLRSLLIYHAVKTPQP